MNRALNLTLLMLLLSIGSARAEEEHDAHEGHTSIAPHRRQQSVFEPRSPALRRFAKRWCCTASSCRIRRGCPSCARVIRGW